MHKVICPALALIFLAITTVTAAINENQAAFDSHAAIVSSTAQAITLSFDLEDVEHEVIFEDNQPSNFYVMDGEGSLLDPGMPQLPAVTRIVIVPAEAGLELVVRAGEPRRENADNPPSRYNEDSEGVMMIDNRPPLNEIYPAVVAEMSEPFIVRGARMVRVTTYPVRYDPQEEVYLHYDNVETEIRFTNEAPVNPSQHSVRRNRSPEFLKFIRSFAINGADIGRDDPDRDREPDYVGHYLVVIHQNCLEYVEDFIEWRRKSGWKVDILRLSGGDASNSGRVKSRIQEVYDAYLEEGMDPFDQIMLIGDHASYENAGPGPQWILASPQGSPLWGNHAHYDWDYACLEGRDSDADVGISRWIAGSPTTLDLFMHRTMHYEVEPYMEDTDWFTRGAVYAQNWAGNYHVSLATNVRWGYQVLESLGFDDIRRHENMDQRDVNQVGQFLTRQFNDGVNVMVGRAENYYYRSGFQGVNRSDIYPIDLCLGGHHEWSCWHMMRNIPANQPRGPVAATTGWGGPQTGYMNIIWLQLVSGFMMHDMTFGWSRLKMLLGAEQMVPNYHQMYSNAKTDNVHYGDPGLQYWKGVPLEVEVEHPETMMPTDRLIEVHVIDPEADEEEQDVEGAQVTLYYPRDLPDGDENGYAEYDEMFMVTKKSETDGMARFILPEDLDLERGTMYVTVTGREILPNLGEIEIVNPRAGVELTDWSLDQVEGNDDEDINPGEIFTLNLTARNLSQDDALNNVTATVTSMSPYVEVTENNEIAFGDIDAEGEVESEEGVNLNIVNICPDGASRPVTLPSLRIEFSSDEDRWETAIELDPIAPDFIVRRVVGGIIIADGMDDLNIEIENVGRMPAPAVSATLVTLGMGVSVIEEDAVYPALDPGEHARLENEEQFRIAGNRVVVPGSVYDMVVILETEAGFIDSAFFQLQVAEPRANAPQGPDGYGYLCFDDTDRDWDMAPVYDWIEISRRDNDRDFDGIEIEEFNGQSSHNIGETAVIDLPFETQFYGQLYDQITVATNGFISMGDQEYVTNYQNWPMDHAVGGGVGMLAPLWDDLQLPNNSGVYYYHDEQDSRFIIEWYKMRHRTGGNRDLIFEVILYDHEIWITETGDQNVLFQYKQVSDVAGRNNNYVNTSPYASVGISSSDGTTGLNYSFANRRPVTSAPLTDRRALLFSTSPRYKAGDLFGVVTDHENDAPVEGAIISTQHGFTAISDAEGNWRINDALAEIEFDIMCIKQGYNDSTKYDMFVAEDSLLEINFDILHPEFTPSTYRLASTLEPDMNDELRFTLENTGNGPLDWRVERRLLGDANAAPWEFRRTYTVGADRDESRIQGVIFGSDSFYVSGGNGGDPLIYVYSRDGEFVRSFDQPVNEGRGMRDLAWDGELIWGAADDRVYGISNEGEVVHEWDGPNNINSGITWDPDREVIWVCYTTNNPVAYTREGELIDTLEVNRHGLRIYGLAYWQDDPDNHPLYAFHKDRDTNNQTVHKFDPVTSDTIRVTYLVPEAGGSPEGAFITNQFDVYSWVMMTISNISPVQGGDRIDIWQVEARREWFQLDLMIDENERVEADTGRIETGEEIEFAVRLNSEGLPDTLFQSELLFYHNADSGRGHVFIDLDVIGEEPPRAFDLLEPEDGAEVDPTVVMFAWNYSWDPNFDEEASYVVWISADTLTTGFAIADTSLTVDFDTLDFDIEWMQNNCALWWIDAVSGADTVESNQRFMFTFDLFPMPPSIFDLVAPADSSTVDSILTFQWDPSFDPNDEDTLIYAVWLQWGDDSTGFNLADTALTVDMDTLDLRFDTSLPFTWWVVAESGPDEVECNRRFIFNLPPSLLNPLDDLPVEFSLHSIYPNPFNAITTITFGADKAEHTILRAYDIAGREAARLFDGVPAVGYHQVVWNASALPSGIYLIRLDSAGRVKIAKTALLK